RCMPTPYLDYLDPFLLLDHFGSHDPRDYLAGFPMHPHRGIETVTYILEGEVHHKDSLGNSGKIGKGDVQWMTAGRGILHEEMPKAKVGKMLGFQLWVNLPASLKMSPPRYQEIPSDTIPEIHGEEGLKIRVIAGEYEGQRGPVTEIAANPLYLDVALPQATSFSCPVDPSHTAFIYIYVGEGYAPQKYDDIKLSALKLAVYNDGDTITIRTENNAVRFLLIAGQPLDEPIVRHGPIVMNTDSEIEQALFELKSGLFIT
ncbi:MAG: pirin family protein, partial [Chloroflexi bacterium]|nr:pirin family protein [Chloroflexota bacterium]